MKCVTAIVLLLAGTVAVPSRAQAQALPGSWIPDQGSGCKVWNPHPQPGETVYWIGACAGGFAHGPGAAQWLRNSVPFESDEGEWRAGRQTGNGSQAWPSGRYDGDLTDGEPHGHGVMIVQGMRYEGDFRSGKPNGAGTLTNGSESLRGTWTNGCFRDGPRKASFGVPLSSCP
jgi:hypothetical protein